MNVEPNPRAVTGGNNPPSPFDDIKQEIEDLHSEAFLWCDDEPLVNQAQADDITNLKYLLKAAEARAEALRKEQAKPFDDGKAEVQARFAPLIADTRAVQGLVPKAITAINAKLKPWLEKLEQEKRAAEEDARRAAEETRLLAEQAIRHAKRDNMQEMKRAEALVQQAKQAERSAKSAEKDKARAGTVGRTAHLRTVRTGHIFDKQAFARHSWIACPEEYDEFLDALAKKMVDQGVHKIPGVEILEEKKVVG